MIEYAKRIGANEEVLNWLNTTGSKYLKKGEITESELEHITDYLTSKAAPKRLQRMSIKDAKRKTEEWVKSKQKKGKDLKDNPEDIEIAYHFKDGTSVVKLETKKAYEREGFLMNHCLGGYDPQDGVEIYSYRDKKNMPHATLELRTEENEILQIKGKGNNEVHPKYIHHILEFLQAMGMSIRPSEMKYLGYYHIDKDHLDFLNKYDGATEQVITINGEVYAY